MRLIGFVVGDTFDQILNLYSGVCFVPDYFTPRPGPGIVPPRGSGTSVDFVHTHRLRDFLVHGCWTWYQAQIPQSHSRVEHSSQTMKKLKQIAISIYSV